MSYFANPARFERLAKTLMPVLATVATILLPLGLVDALLISPPDYQQGDAVRIMYIHVPSAWLSMATYAACGVAAIIAIVWKHTLAELFLRAALPFGAAATAMCLVTGMLWGKPMWGTWWVWDARLTSVLVLFFIYIATIALLDAFDRPEQGGQAAAWLTVIGLVNLPIIKYSVEWWNTLHQPSSLSSMKRMLNPAMAADMIRPLMLMTIGLTCLAAIIVTLRMKIEIMKRKRK
ncbi:MAG: heme ABC transporter permease [Alphaproteobacteria bacterium]|nr:heme ABC transporter permease [Alphaproteobacteria bacterium]